MDNKNENQSWNYKRIFVAIFLIAALSAGAYYVSVNVLGNKINPFEKNKKPEPTPVESVKGTTTSEEKVDIQEAIKEKIEDIKKDVGKLNVVDIASSSPPVKKILNDIKALQEYPANELKGICKQICGL